MSLWNQTTPTIPNESVWSDEDKYKGDKGDVQTLYATSSSTHTIAGGVKTFITNTRVNGWAYGQRLKFSVQGGVYFYAMEGIVLSANDNSVTVQILLISGTGTFSNWVISVTGYQGAQGIQGIQGIKGDKGDKGDTGDIGLTGATGNTGADGNAATVTVGTVTTGDEGSSVIVTNSGTTSAAILDFTIPRGDTGSGASAYADLTDGTTVNLPSVNAPLSTALAGKQATLVSGANIKTVNGTSLLGSGNISNDTGKYACSVFKSGAVAGITGTINNYNNVLINDGQLNAATGVYTVPVTGVYKVEFDAIKHNDNTDTEVGLFKNGVFTHVRSYMNSPTNTTYSVGHFTSIANYNAGDTLDVRINFGSVHGNDSCYLTIFKLR